MDKVFSFRDKYMLQTSDDVADKVVRGFSQAKSSIKSNEEHLAQNELKVEALRAKIIDIEDKIEEETRKNHSLFEDLHEHNESLKRMESELDRLMAENQKSQIKKNQLQHKLAKLNPKDEQLLDHGRKKMDYYKMLTGIRWDYSTLLENTKGFVTNQEDYIRPFCLDLHDKDTENKLWQEVAKGSGRLTEL